MDVETLMAKKAELEQQLLQTAQEYNQIVAFVRGKIEALQELIDKLKQEKEEEKE